MSVTATTAATTTMEVPIMARNACFILPGTACFPSS